MEVASLLEGAWSCYRGGHCEGRRIDVTVFWREWSFFFFFFFTTNYVVKWMLEEKVMLRRV